MTDFISVFIPSFFIVFFLFAFLAPSLKVAKRIGKNPNTLPKDDSAYGLIGRYFKLTLFLLFIYTVLLFFFPTEIVQRCSIRILETHFFKYAGIVLMILGFITVIAAQSEMKNSWRIGIDEEVKTELITTGLFKYSRNPVFLGILMCLIGLFLVIPTFISAGFFLVASILIQIQIRLEEVFLLQQHGTSYLEYKKKVRRMM